ncbi:MAG: hypothetical protein RL490_907, partial [Pseudomonadota bacterium]
MIAATGPQVTGFQPGKDQAITPTAASIAVPTTLPATRRWAAEAWALAQAARDPFVILITIYIFTPYYVTRVIGDPVAGQTLV